MTTEKEFKGNVGLFLVCAEFSKRNLIAIPTSRNTKGYDVVVLNPKTNKSIGIQTKCTDKKDFPIFSSNWHDYEFKIEQKILSPFIFVDISDVTQPKYYILSKTEIKNVLQNIIKEYIDSRLKKYGMTETQLFDKEKKDKRKSDLWALRIEKIQKYENKWESITNAIH